MLSDNMEIILENDNHSDHEKRFPVISVLRRAHDILNKMVTLSMQWRVHARYLHDVLIIVNELKK